MDPEEGPYRMRGLGVLEDSLKMSPPPKQDTDEAVVRGEFHCGSLVSSRV